MSYLRKGAHRDDKHKASFHSISDATSLLVWGGALGGRHRI